MLSMATSSDALELNRSVLEAASWRLASELVRRHPELRILRTHPTGGMYDCLTIVDGANGSGVDIQLNRNGRIHILGTASTRPGVVWEPTEWFEYMSSDPREFLGRLERAAGLPAPPQVPASPPRSLTYRVLAAVAVTSFMTVHPIEIESGYIDASGEGGSHRNADLDLFAAIPTELRRPKPEDVLGVAEYRFWIVERRGVPIVAIEQDSATSWCQHRDDGFDIAREYRAANRDLFRVVASLLAFADC